MELVEFLLARIADDEAHARNAFGEHNDVGPEWTEIWSGAVELGGNQTDGPELLLTNDSQVSRHIERWDPARVLAECVSKRRLIQLGEKDSYWDDVLRILAIPYTEHEDFNPDWRL
jgi:hypothetical protein